MCFSTKRLRKVLMGVLWWVSIWIMSIKYPQKMLSSNLQMYGFSYVGDSIQPENCEMKNISTELSNQMWFSYALIEWRFVVLEIGVFNYFVLQTATESLSYLSKKWVLKIFWPNIFDLKPGPSFFLGPKAKFLPSVNYINNLRCTWQCI